MPKKKLIKTKLYTICYLFSAPWWICGTIKNGQGEEYCYFEDFIVINTW